MKQKNIKRNLILSIIILLTYTFVFIGSTFAWFTDSASTGVNQIKSGNLDIVLEYRDTDGNWNEITQDTKLFNDEALWEPGYTEVTYIRIKNNGSLAFEYELKTNILNEVIGTNNEGTPIKLSDFIISGNIVSETEMDPFASRDAAIEAITNNTTNLKDFTNKGVLASKAETYITLVTYMPDTVGNEANSNGVEVPSIEFGISAYATQANQETDSFDNNYDEKAQLPSEDTTTPEENI